MENGTYKGIIVNSASDINGKIKKTMLCTGNALVTECYICMVRMICQFMNHGEYKGEAYIYSHNEVLRLIWNIAEELLLEKETRFIKNRLHFVEVHDIFDPYEKHHSTVKDACEPAEKLNVRNLLHYHTEACNLSERKNLYQTEGARYFEGNLYIPDDLETLEL